MNEDPASPQIRRAYANKAEGNRILLTAKPLMDLVELEDGCCLYCDLPGVGSDEVELTVDKESLHIRAVARLTPLRGKIRALEFSDIMYEGEVRVSAVDPSRVEASLVNGLLRVFMPFPAPSMPVRIAVTAR